MQMETMVILRADFTQIYTRQHCRQNSSGISIHGEVTNKSSEDARRLRNIHNQCVRGIE